MGDNIAEHVLAKWTVHAIGGSASVLEMLASEGFKFEPATATELSNDIDRLRTILKQMTP